MTSQEEFFDIVIHADNTLSTFSRLHKKKSPGKNPGAFFVTI